MIPWGTLTVGYGVPGRRSEVIPIWLNSDYFVDWLCFAVIRCGRYLCYSWRLGIGAIYSFVYPLAVLAVVYIHSYAAETNI